ncbi:MAG: TetR/AcrR family transcriptional regulator [Proteobacteria bacterium]|nr:TetR/AcrR family transcriptional regulator [Pseudomonadota bacterium]
MPGAQKNPVGTRRQKQKSDTRDLILKIALNHFEKNGYSKTTIRGIASDAGIAVGTIFSHFKDKFSLLADLIYNDLEAEMWKAIDSIPSRKPIHDQFNHCAKHFYSYWMKNPDLTKSFLVELVLSSSEWTQRFDVQIGLFLQHFEKKLEIMKKKGQIKTTVDSQIAVASFWSHYFLVLVTEFRNPSPNLKNMLNMLLQMNKQTLDGISVQQPA